MIVVAVDNDVVADAAGNASLNLYLCCLPRTVAGGNLL